MSKSRELTHVAARGLSLLPSGRAVKDTALAVNDAAKYGTISRLLRPGRITTVVLNVTLLKSGVLGEDTQLRCLTQRVYWSQCVPLRQAVGKRLECRHSEGMQCYDTGCPDLGKTRMMDSCRRWRKVTGLRTVHDLGRRRGRK
jgi:hypothetical protein